MIEEMTRSRIKAAYVVEGYLVSELMDLTGKSYEDIRNILSESGAVLITGGPHDTATCHHDHTLAALHAAGRCPHPVKARKRTTRQRRELELQHG